MDSQELAVRLIRNAVDGIFDGCGNSYVNSWTQKWLEGAKQLGAYEGHVVGVVKILRERWADYQEENAHLFTL